MTVTVGIISQKGGTRKSTLARAIGVAYTKAGWVTRICDMDPNQATCNQWNKRRAARDIQPPLDVKMYGQLSPALAERDNLDMMIIDGKPHGSEVTAEIAQASDLVLIPTGTGIDDLEPSVTLALLLVENHQIDPTKIAFVLTNMGTSIPEVVAAQAYLEESGFLVIPGYLSIKASFSKAHDIGLAVTEALSKSPKNQANRLVKGIINRIEQLTDQ